MTLRRLQIIAALVVCASWIVPVRQLAAAPPVPVAAAAAAPVAIDIELDAAGRLVGQAIDGQGRLLVAERVVVSQAGQEIASTVTDDQGRFAIEGMLGGLYQVATAQGGAMCRVWMANTAPPVAKPHLLLAAGTDVERGQRPVTDLLHPVLIGLIIAAAIAIPIALHDDDAS
ncbi:MAG: carboxypeptidase regulatory-like domain-containing protein [Planctomycetales bacterium]|nr:carboxypeptidase regulatory-like domain-containing protein [Planctomycetales bacterium]